MPENAEMPALGLACNLEAHTGVKWREKRRERGSRTSKPLLSFIFLFIESTLLGAGAVADAENTALKKTDKLLALLDFTF